MEFVFNIFKKAYLTFCYALINPLISKRERQLIEEDFRAICQKREVHPTFAQFLEEFVTFKEFRSLVYFRLRNRFRLLPKLFLKPQTNLFIFSQNIAGGMIIEHGFATVVNAESIGTGFTVFQQVTIGRNAEGFRPRIGNNCTIYCGALVIGDITIGDNVTIGAGAVVVKDVPSGATVVGNPARIIKESQD